ncbi:MAG TPA: hypothetical protein VH279_13440 [Solirubrobacteraceae bacterium]|nr:hypothetical protein [Solirubrobacteraceae bacterium]
MASQKSKRRSRKRRNPDSVPRAVPSERRSQRTEQRAAPTPQRAPSNPMGAYGERPPSPFGGLPISEIAIAVGAIGLIVGLIQGGEAALIAGVAVCTLGVVEITAREHFSGYRSHTILLSALPAVAAEVAFVAIAGEPNPRLLLLVVIVPVFSLMFWFLRQRFLVARQARVARPPTA